MINGIKIRVDNNRKDNEFINYNYKVKDGKINIYFDYDKKDDLIIRYDENVFSIKLDNYESNDINCSEIKLIVKNNKKISFDVIVNNKFFVRSVFNYINKYDDKVLLEELNIFKDCSKKYNKKITDLINEISNCNNPSDIEEVLLLNELHASLGQEMNAKDLMLMIVNAFSSSKLPKVSQEMFNDMVKEAINYQYPLENVWRLSMNFDMRGYNYDLLDKFFVDSKDSWYLAEYISIAEQVNRDKIVKMVIDTNDKEFIKEFLDEVVVQNELDDKNLTLLEKAIKN